MKKFIVCMIAIVIIILVVVLLKNNSTTKYSHSDIRNLILKGIENMENMNNVYFEKEDEMGTTKYYYKGNKMKMIVPENLISVDGTKSKLSSVITNLEEGKQYLIKEESKLMLVTSATTMEKTFQHKTFQSINNNNPNSRYKYEFSYIRDEKIDNKDCIFVKEKLFYRENNEYIELGYDSESDIRAYWIEKSTGFIIGATMIKSDKDPAIPDSIIKKIKFGEVTDKDFELPNNYEIIERNF